MKLSVLVFLLCCCVISAKAQCIPNVFNVRLENSTTMQWERSNNCENTTYLVSIYAYDTGIIEFVGNIDSGSLDVSFLPFCRAHIFTVSAISGIYVGPYSQTADVRPLPEGANITVANLTAYQIDTDVVLEWQVPFQYQFCLDTYKLSIWNGDSAEPEEISTNRNRFTLNEAAACMSYQVVISVVYASTEYPVTRFNYSVPAATNNPYLQALEQYETSIHTTWGLEGYSLNRCEVISLVITGTAINVTIGFQDSPERLPIPLPVVGLKANTMYYFNVTTKNEAGVSKPFQLAVQTLPSE